MAGVVFLDSSVLFNLLDVPAKNSDRSEVIARFSDLSVRRPRSSSRSPQ